MGVWGSARNEFECHFDISGTLETAQKRKIRCLPDDIPTISNCLRFFPPGANLFGDWSSEHASIGGYEGSLEPRESITVNINGAVARLALQVNALHLELPSNFMSGYSQPRT
ncbi:hypothetical protein TcasGA2_TC001963 [Tribolium castaneum]|uniref:Uncharacterized protein n=1 Tax=Tribolium castaneum TaxID=7070 RepID=D7EJ28_TRICA|nr:hypothetical protein TcasGA2_TC001963 [Tribolium castaneum]